MRFVIVIFCCIALGLVSCTQKTDNTVSVDQADVQYRVEPAPEWTALFKRYSGWFGGDGIFAIPFSGNDAAVSAQDSILFVFSDTMVGEIADSTLQPGYKMVNNSVMILHGEEPLNEKARFLVNRKDTGEVAVFVPSTPQTKPDDYYWLGDGFVNHATDSNLYIFAYRIRNTHDGSLFPFREVGNALLIIPQGGEFPFHDHRQAELPFSNFDDDSRKTSFGVGVLVNTASAGSINADGFIYVYGTRGKTKELVVSRVKAGSLEDFSTWEFWNGSAWMNDVQASAPVADSVSNELSVTPIGKDQYALIYQYGGIFPTICMQIGPSPVGPFGPRKKIWDTSGDLTTKNLFSYNAKAHPAISKPGELLVSYNVNSFKFFDDIEGDPNLYRPRFVRIIFDKE